MFILGFYIWKLATLFGHHIDSDQIANFRVSIANGKGRCLCRHGFSILVIFNHLAEVSHQLTRIELSFLPENSSAGSLKNLSINRLVIVCCMRIGNEN